MIPTRQIREALRVVLEGSGLCEKVLVHSDADLSAALEHLRSHPKSLAVIVPSKDEWLHEVEETDNTPLRAEVRNQFEILVSNREINMRETGTPDCVDLKDQICELLCWHNLAVPGLLCLPLETEPMILELNERRGREAWRIVIEARQRLFS